MSKNQLIPSPDQNLVEALDELSLVICRALGERCLMCHVSTDLPVPDIDAEELEAALSRVRLSLRQYRDTRQDHLHEGH